MYSVEWIRSKAGSYLRLMDANLSSCNAYGVYVIWRPGGVFQSPLTVRVGSGNIADRLSVHRNDSSVTGYGPDLLFTFCEPPLGLVQGIERYVGGQLFPVVGERFPAVTPVAVNLPVLAA